MRICFFGSAPIAVATLDRLLERHLDVCAVFSQPDRPAGRGGKMHMTAVKERALACGLPIHTPEEIKSPAAAELLRTYNPELVVIVAYGHLIPKSLLEIPARGFINLHASLLPKYRGAAPVPHAILNGEKETGVTVFRLNERFDAGDILARERLTIEPDDTSETVLQKLAPIGAELVCKVIGEFMAGWTHPVAQHEEQATKAPKLTKYDGLLDWEETPDMIDCKVRAYQPWPLCHTFTGTGKKIRRLCILKVQEYPAGSGGAFPGEIIHAEPKEGLVVACGGGKAVRILHLKPEGKKEMDAPEFLRGHHFQPGERLGERPE